MSTKIYFLMFISFYYQSIIYSQTVSKINKFCYNNENPIDSILSINPDIFYVPVNSTVSMACGSCGNERIDQNLRWFKKIVYDSSLKEIKKMYNNQRIFITTDNNLIIKFTSIEDSGFYYCQEYPPEKYPNELVYYLDVIKNIPHKSGGINDFQILNNKIQDLKKSFEKDNNRFTVFMQWRILNSCRVTGNLSKNLKRSIGRCNIKMINPGKDMHKDFYYRNIQTFYVPYKLQLSCQSAVLEKYFPSIFSTANVIPDYILEERCCIGENCSVVDALVLDIILSVHDTTVLPCTGSSLGSNVTWHKGLNKIKDDDHRMIDDFNALHLVDVKPKDKGLYFCKLNDKVYRQYNIIVKPLSKVSVEDLWTHLVYLSCFFFVGFSCYCSCLCVKFCNSKP